MIEFSSTGPPKPDVWIQSKCFRSDGDFVLPPGMERIKIGPPVWHPPSFRSSASFAFLAGLKGYDAVVRAVQFSVTVDLMTTQPIDAGSVESAMLKALATEAFGIVGMAVVTARAVTA